MSQRTGLDPAGIKKLRDILKEISRKGRVAVFVSSHILTEMELMCDKVAVIDKGKIVKIEEVRKDTAESTSLEESIITVKQLEEGEKVLKDNGYESQIIEEKLSVKASHDKIPEILKLLAKNDVDVFNVIQKERSLEDIFFDATKKKENEKGGQEND